MIKPSHKKWGVFIFIIMKLVIKESQLYRLNSIVQEQLDNNDVVPEPEYEMPDLTKVDYKELNAKQKESYNFQKISGVLADYGYFPIRLSDDWESADFICIKCTTKKFLKVQLKGSFTLDKKYVGKDLYIAFQNKKTGQWYLYPHDYIVKKYTEDKGLENKGSWVKIGYIFNNPPTNYDLSILEPFKL
jgi:hypothetical protein